MKKRTKGILAFAFLGGIMVTSTVVIAIPGLAPTEMDSDPLIPRVTDVDHDYSENYKDTERVMFCGTGQPPDSTAFVREFEIPTACTNPLAIAVDYNGNPWFVESNTGRVATFDPETETFTEYPNPSWPLNATSMMWGMDYAPDGLVWFTDDWSDSIWVFNTVNGQYGNIPYPRAANDPLPQRLLIDGSQVIVNDFYGNMLTFLDPNQPDSFLIAPSPIDGAVTAGFAPDDAGNIWYTSWLYPDGNGFLVKFHHARYVDVATTLEQPYLPPIDFVDLYELPSSLQTPNGITISSDGNIWLAGTTSSYVFEFNPSFGYFTQYVTADPMPSTYGNHTGVIKTPISRPYWMATDDVGRIVFNSQTSNNISVLDPASQKLVEYHVPSKNPYWADCSAPTITNDTATVTPISTAERCGVAQIFDFDVYDDQIWFTEWAENKIGVVDTAIPLPFDINVSSDSTVFLERGAIESFSFDVVVAANDIVITNDTGVQFTPFATSASEYVSALILSDLNNNFDTVNNDQKDLTAEITNPTVLISVSGNAPSGIYKVLLGAQASDVAIGKFVTVTVP